VSLSIGAPTDLKLISVFVVLHLACTSNRRHCKSGVTRRDSNRAGSGRGCDEPAINCVAHDVSGDERDVSFVLACVS
jgi:hypothetical protein